jgi:Carboxypeptidase activation peptide
MARWLVAILLFSVVSAAIASESDKIYKNYKVYDIKPKSEDDLKFLKDLEEFEADERSLDFLSLHNKIGEIARVAVMPKEQNYIEDLFKSRKIDYKIKTANLQE